MSAAEEPSHLLEMPKIEFGQYLLDYAFEVGPSKSSGMGPTTIEWTDVQAWSFVTGTKVSAWEALVMIEISKALVQQYYLSEGHIIPSPYQPVEYDKGAASNRIGNLLRGLATRSKQSKKR